MHPDLYLVVYRQQERELETALRRRRVVAERAVPTAAAPRPHRSMGATLGRLAHLARPVPSPVCCAA